MRIILKPGLSQPSKGQAYWATYESSSAKFDAFSCSIYMHSLLNVVITFGLPNVVS
jgi:hypothetical protein